MLPRDQPARDWTRDLGLEKRDKRLDKRDKKP